jgi:hypothetical protein
LNRGEVVVLLSEFLKSFFSSRSTSKARVNAMELIRRNVQRITEIKNSLLNIKPQLFTVQG